MTDAVEEKGKQLVVEREKEDSNNNKTYPKPLAKYEDVVADRKLLMETLEKLHAALGTKFMIPIIGGKDLDLHRLFVEVTSRGGIEKVIRDRRWREVTSVFNFPSTATNASFILRKYYISLMHHYEQIYFFGAQGSNSPPPASLHAPSVTPVPSKRFVEPVPLSHETRVATQKRKKCDRVSLPTNYPVVGVVDGKFEHGYLVTVTVGTAKLKGILYHPPEQTAAQAPQDSGIADNNTVGGIRRRRRRKKLSSRDPTHPKPNRSGYNFFFAEQHAKLKLLHPGKDREISKMIGDLWSKLTETEKAVYQEIGLRDKERYRSEMTEYRERLKTGQIIRNAVPIQQRPAEQVVAMGDVDSKGEMEEGDLPSTHQNESSDGSDFEGKKSDKESELDTSPEAGGTATESTSFVAEPSAEVDGFELRMRDHVRTGNEHEIPSSSEDAESKKEVDSSIDKH